MMKPHNPIRVFLLVLLMMVYCFADHWAFFGMLSSGSATGEHEDNETATEISSSATTLSGGLQWSYDIDFNDDGQEDLMPFIGAGLSLQKYSYDFNYEESEMGNTSGSGYGPLMRLGFKINASSHFVIIPGYHYSQIYIKTEEGSDRTMTSSGISLALVARF